MLSGLTAHGTAQEVEATGKAGAAVFSPADYVELTAPVTDRVSVNAYGFYLGNIQGRIALLEMPMSLRKFFTLTPSYLAIDVPPPGLTLLSGEPSSTGYREHQFRVMGTFAVTAHRFTISDGNMYARRITPSGNVNRYRNRISVARTLSAGAYRFTPFVFDEVYHDAAPGPWLRRNWFVAAVNLPITRYLTFQPSYIRQDDQFLRSVQFLGVGLIVRTGQLFGHAGDERNN